MGTNTRMELDPVEQLKSILDDAPRNHDFLAGYVREIELYRNEEDTFLRLAFANVSPGGPSNRRETFVVSVVSEMYEPLNPDQKVEVRRWWHEKVHGEAEQFPDLRARLSKVT